MAIKETLGNVWGKAKSGTITVSLEAKKKMKESSIKGEISSLEAKMTGVFTQIGREAYENLPDALEKNEKTKALLDSVGEMKDQIAAKEKELEEEMAKFDQEIAALKAGENPAPAAEEKEEPPKTEAAEESKRFCTHCGAQNSADAAFCGSCGAKL
jgi:sec-independent protein translocase protein TatA